MLEIPRANCPLTGTHCEGRQHLLDLQTELSIEAANPAPNIITDDDSLGHKLVKRTLNFLSSGNAQDRADGLGKFSRAIDDALDTEPDQSISCLGSSCGTLGNLALAYGRTFMPEGFQIQVNLHKEQ